MTHATIRLAPIIVLLVALGACGDDEPADGAVSAATAPPASEEDLSGFCALAEELNSQEAPPSSEQLASYAELAPDAIAEPTAVVVAAFDAAGDDFAAVFADADAVAAIEQIQAFEGEACGFAPPRDPSVTEIDPDAMRVDLTATDYHFDVSPPSTAGRYSFVMANGGAEPHLMILAQLEEGVTIDEVMASEGETGLIASFESGIAAPGTDAVVSLDLTPGRWVLVCPIPNAEGTPHAALGMVHEFMVG